MKTATSKIFFISIILFSTFLLMPTMLWAGDQKVRVISENAAIRMNPNFESEIIESPTKGKVFEVVSITGEWYEIKFISRIGIAIFGYIHKKDVEVIYAEEKVTREIKVEPEPEKAKVVTTPILVEEKKVEKKLKIELVANAGLNMGYGITESFTYKDNFSASGLERADENGSFEQKADKPFSFGGALNAITDKGIGFQARVDINSNVKISGTSDYILSWKWTGNSTVYTRDNQWDVTGSISSMVVSGNFIFKPSVSEMFAPVISGGFSYFTGNLKVDSKIGYGFTWLVQVGEDLYTRYIDYWSLPALINKPTNGVGFNFGGGVDILFSQNIGLNIDVRYFYKSKVQIPWEITPGTYPSTIHSVNLSINEDGADEIEKILPKFELNQSFFKLSLGLVFKF
jgi:hypothetical protein